MLKVAGVLFGLAAAGCVAPEPPPPAPRAASASVPRPANLEPAPLANRAARDPGSSSLVNVDLGALANKKPKAEQDATPAK